MPDNRPDKRKPLFAGIAMACALAGLLLSRMAGARFGSGEALEGYGSLGLTVSFLVALLLSGLIMGQIGLIRGERPLALPVLALLLNGAIFVMAIITLAR